MPDSFSDRQAGLASPVAHGAAVTPSDSVDLTTFSRALWVGSAGNVVVTTAGGSTITFANVPAGTILPVRVARVHATNTTAGSILALW